MGFSLYNILNIEYRTRNFEQQKVLKGIKRRPQLEQRRKMMSLFLFYQEDQQMFLNRLVENFNQDVNKMGVELKITNVDEV